MPIMLYRVDDRLVHGQVVIGWGKPLAIGLIVLVDDSVAASDWERDLYRMGVPQDTELIFASVADAEKLAPAWRADPRNAILLTADVATMCALAERAAPVPSVTLGGLHHKPGRRGRLPYVYLTDEEFGQLQALATRGTQVTAQDLPTSAPIPLEALR